jgi:hypothetical protein
MNLLMQPQFNPDEPLMEVGAQRPSDGNSDSLAESFSD